MYVIWTSSGRVKSDVVLKALQKEKWRKSIWEMSYKRLSVRILHDKQLCLLVCH